jgi:CHAD domain-containing protein
MSIAAMRMWISRQLGLVSRKAFGIIGLSFCTVVLYIMPVSISGYELLQTRARRFTRMLHRFDEQDVRTVHRARVATRRLRELLPVLQAQDGAARELGDRLRRITKRLGKVRELDALLLLVDELRGSGRYELAALDRVKSTIVQERAEAGERLATKLPARELRRVSTRLDKLADAIAASETVTRRDRTRARSLRWAVDARIHRRASSLKRAIVAAGAVYLPDRLHAVRIALKKFRYAVELANDLAGDERLAGTLRTLKRDQDVLGSWHDRQVLIERVRQTQASLTPPEPDMWRRLDVLMTALENECRQLHARYRRQSEGLLAICDGYASRLVTAVRQAG